MLRLPPLELHQPATLHEAVELVQRLPQPVRVIAGGTDLLPNMKLRQTAADHLVSLRRIPELQGVARGMDGGLVIGAATRLCDLAVHADVLAVAPALADAAGRVASPQIRNRATLGGNLCLDTRCRYVNQSELWREALGGCLKSHGSECHVVPGGQGCVAALSSDTAPVLIAYGASAEFVSGKGNRWVPVAELYDTDGLDHVRKARDELLVRVKLPPPSPNSRFAYRKWAVRKAIDFPLVSVAVRLDCARDVLAGGVLVVGVLGPRPRVLDLTKLHGRKLDAALAHELGQVAFQRCHPLPNVPYDPEYRRLRLEVEVRRAVRLLVC
jgi:4-hydroxybenzoyl-CoA reductase subunit beta